MERNGMNLFRIEKTKVNEEERFVIACGKYRASNTDFKTKESAEDYVANMIDWDRLVTIVGQLSEHIAEKKVNEIVRTTAVAQKAMECIVTGKRRRHVRNRMGEISRVKDGIQNKKKMQTTTLQTR